MLLFASHVEMRAQYINFDCMCDFGNAQCTPPMTHLCGLCWTDSAQMCGLPHVLNVHVCVSKIIKLSLHIAKFKVAYIQKAEFVTTPTLQPCSAIT